MSTIPFVQVEGSIALPRMRPLDRIPPPFGREWTLLPPHFSLRTELKAFYAAIMRTVCLSAEAFRAACRWDLHRRMLPDPAAAPVAGTAQASASGSAARAASAADPFTPTTSTRADALRTARRARKNRMPQVAKSKLAGGACAIGGAALLTWLMASHAPHGDKPAAAPALAHSDRDAGSATSQRLANERAAHDVAVAASAPPVVAVTPSASSSAKQPDFSVTGNATAAQRVTVAPSVANGASRAAQPNATAGKQTARSKSNSTAQGSRSQRATHLSAPHRVESRNVTRRTTGMYSEAGHYSPLHRPGMQQDDDYASIATYANTYTAPRATSGQSIPADSTEWVNHVSQRRVTEIPDRFEK